MPTADGDGQPEQDRTWVRQGQGVKKAIAAAGHAFAPRFECGDDWPEQHAHGYAGQPAERPAGGHHGDFPDAGGQLPVVQSIGGGTGYGAGGVAGLAGPADSLWRSTLNLQSYMGMIMSVGVSISNAVLLITNAEQLRKYIPATPWYVGYVRLRLCGSALYCNDGPGDGGGYDAYGQLGLGEAGDQSSPLGRAVIGGLVASTFAALLILPLAFAWGQGNAGHTKAYRWTLKTKRVSTITLIYIKQASKL
jgi:hypothetical protein